MEVNLIGQEIATYVKNNFIKVLKSIYSFSSGDYKQALID